jgi:hypothetical protein
MIGYRKSMRTTYEEIGDENRHTHKGKGMEMNKGWCGYYINALQKRVEINKIPQTVDLNFLY